mgnify:FL=1
MEKARRLREEEHQPVLATKKQVVAARKEELPQVLAARVQVAAAREAEGN